MKKPLKYWYVAYDAYGDPNLSGSNKSNLKKACPGYSIVTYTPSRMTKKELADWKNCHKPVRGKK